MSRGYKDTSAEDGYVITSGRVAKGLTIQDALSLEEIEASTEEMLENKVAKAQALKDVNNKLTPKKYALSFTNQVSNVAINEFYKSGNVVTFSVRVTTASSLTSAAIVATIPDDIVPKTGACYITLISSDPNVKPALLGLGSNKNVIFAFDLAKANTIYVGMGAYTC